MAAAYRSARADGSEKSIGQRIDRNRRDRLTVLAFGICNLGATNVPGFPGAWFQSLQEAGGGARFVSAGGSEIRRIRVGIPSRRETSKAAIHAPGHSRIGS